MLPVCKERWLITTYKVKVRYFADLFQKVWFQILLKVPRGVKASALQYTTAGAWKILLQLSVNKK